MRFVILCMLCGAILCFNPYGTSADFDMGGHSSELEITKDFETNLDLWRDGRYEELYERTYGKGSRSRETFIRRLTAATRKPACCWEKLQEVSVSNRSGKKATLHARIGFESRFGATEYHTRSFSIKRENGIWKPAMADILSLAGKPGR